MEPSRRPASGTQLDPGNPWPGLESYDEPSHDFFSGRSAEADELQRRVMDEPVTVLFGKSGLGKTSLLKAGVFPRLREKGLLPIFLRLQVRPRTETLIEQARLALFDELRTQEIEHPPPSIDETLWEYLHRTGLEFWTRQNRLVRPVFVFDQFEELFTLGRVVPAEVEAFREDLADLAENRIPAALARRLENRPASEIGLDLQAMSYKVVISLREDFLADLEGWRLTMPSLRRNRMRLLPMGPEQALQAVCNERTEHLVSEPLARKIVAFLSSGAATVDGAGSPEGAGLTVEPALLSLFCRGVNEHRKRDGKTRFDEALLAGGKETIVTDFYRTSLNDQPDKVRRFVEEELITEHGFRNSYSVEDALNRGFVTATGLETLVNRRLLRQEHHLGTERVELTHDLLTKAVIEERDVRRRAERAERERQQQWKFWGTTGVLGAIALLFLAISLYAWEQVKELERAESGLKDALKKAKDAADDASRSEFKQWQAARAAWLEQEKAKDAARRAEQERQRANEERDRSKSRELAAIAGAMIDKDPELAVLLALEGLRRKDTAEARSALLEAAQYAWPAAVLEKGQLGGEPTAIALSPDGNQLAVLAGSRLVTLWDVTLRKPAMVWPGPASLPDAMFLAFSPDQKLLAVGRESSVDLLDALSGNPFRSLKQSGQEGRRIVFSPPDGRWLASVHKDQIWLWDYRAEGSTAVTIPAKGVVEIAVLADGEAIVGVGISPSLFAHRFKRLPDGTWEPPTPVDFSHCMRPQSVSPSAGYISATSRASTCLYSAIAPEEQGDRVERDDRPIYDLVWSAGGGSFAQFLTSQDVIVSAGNPRDARRESRIKGARPSGDDDKTRSISMSEDGTRAALIDENGFVRVYSLADHKPFLSRFDGRSLAVAPDGDWIAVARPSAPRKQASVIDVIPIEQGLASDSGGRVRKRIDVGALITQIYATQSSVVAVLRTEPMTTVVFNATTGKPRFDRQGRAQPLGVAGELLLIEPPSGQPWRLITTRDGAPLAPWEQLASGGGPPVFRVSPGKEALAVLRLQSTNKSQANAVVYSVRGNTLVPSGQVVDLPAVLLSAPPTRLQPTDDARSITETRTAQRGETVGRFAWPVTVTGALDRTRPQSPRPLERTGVPRSPLGRFEIQPESGKSSGAKIFNVIRRTDDSIVKPFESDLRNTRFSSDDRWLAVWREKGIQILDLARGEIALDLDLDGVEGVDFEARNTILNVHLADGTMLIPLDRTSMERFAKWLVAPRELANRERCMYGLEGDCRNEIVAPRGPSTSPYGKATKVSR